MAKLKKSPIKNWTKDLNRHFYIRISIYTISQIFYLGCFLSIYQEEEKEGEKNWVWTSLIPINFFLNQEFCKSSSYSEILKQECAGDMWRL